MKDKRIKMCATPNCPMYIKQITFPAEDQFCKRCGQPLIFACKSCLKPIDDKGPEHIKCTLCEAKAADRKQKIINTAKTGAELAFTVVTVVPGGGKVIKTLQKVIKP